MKKNNNHFKQLGSAEMKEIKGGVFPPMFRWYCEIYPTTFQYVCFSVQPDVHCGYESPCASAGVCSNDDYAGCL